jgi:outer membrane protein OmpA-like peptidoglycan-associated protein
LQGNFEQAKKGLDELLIQQPNNTEWLWKRAMCSLENNPSESIPFFEKCATIQPNYHPLLFWYLGHCYTVTQNYDKAINAYEKYKPNNPLKAEQAIKQIQIVQTYMQNPIQAEVTLLDTAKINTVHDEYAPFFFENNFAFIRSIQQQEDIYYIEKDTLKNLFSNNTNNVKIQRSMSCCVGNTLYFYYCTDATTNGDIYTQTYQNNTWGTPKKLPDVINSPYWETAPAINNTQTLLIFASDRPNGLGGTDLYVSIKDSTGNWKPAQNMGAILNTKGNETNPYLSSDGKTLYFASNNHQSLGGYDIFVSYYENGNWTKPQNLGYPVNTIYNELTYFVEDSLHAYIASDRPCPFYPKDNINIYLIKYSPRKKAERNFAEVFIQAKNPQETPISFSVVFQENIQIDTLNNHIQHFTLPKNSRLYATLSAKGYLSQNLTILTTQQDTLFIYPILELLQTKKNYILNNIYFKLNSSELEPESYTAIDAIFTMLQANPQARIQINGHTDNTGNAAKNLTLSEARANSVAQYLISKKIDKNRIVVKGFGSQKPIADNNSEEGRFRNRRVEFEIVE